MRATRAQGQAPAAAPVSFSGKASVHKSAVVEDGVPVVPRSVPGQHYYDLEPTFVVNGQVLPSSVFNVSAKP